jgi:hypothetical protein
MDMWVAINIFIVTGFKVNGANKINGVTPKVTMKNAPASERLARLGQDVPM